MNNIGVIARAQPSTKVEPTHNWKAGSTYHPISTRAEPTAISTWQRTGQRNAVPLTEKQKTRLIALAIIGGIALSFSAWAAGDAWRRTHSRGRAFGAFLNPSVWLLTR